jgi:hypothetical protein
MKPSAGAGELVHAWFRLRECSQLTKGPLMTPPLPARYRPEVMLAHINISQALEIYLEIRLIKDPPGRQAVGLECART